MTVDTPSVIWQPQPGPQMDAIRCPVGELFFGGARGGGKTDFLLGDWSSHAQAYGEHARGIIFRRSMPELDDVIARARELFIPIGATFREQAKEWIFPNGATLRMRYLDRDADADNYQGHQYTWMAFDEAGNWPSPAPIDRLRACLRSAHGVPCMLRLTGNPGGVGHNWLKARYVDGKQPGKAFRDPVTGMLRVFIPSKLTDNRILTTADPTYVHRLRASGEEWLVKAWEEGDWSGPPVGGIINPNWLRTYTVEPPLGSIDLAADLAFRVKQTADRSAIGAFGMTASSELTWKPDIRIGHFDTLTSVEHILELATTYNAERLFVGRDMITGSIGPFLYKIMEERKIWLTVIEVQQHQDQLLRSRSFIARTQQGKVLWPEGDLFRRVIHPELVGYHGRGEQPDDIVAMAAHACMGLDSASDYTAPAKPKWVNEDEKRWKAIDQRKNRAPSDAIQPLFGRRH
jgi:hypothetical protein